MKENIPIEKYIDFINIETDAPGFGDDFSKINRSSEAITKYGVVRTQCQSKNTIQPIITFLSNTAHPATFVEIGVYGGGTLLQVYEKFNENVKIYGIDPFEEINIFNGVEEEHTNLDVVEDWRAAAKQRKEHLLTIINDNNLDINIIQETSWKACDSFENGSISCIHIDGDHSCEGLTKDLNGFWPKIQNGGMIIVDDYTWPSCKKAVDSFIEQHSKFIVLDELDVFNKKIFYKHEA